MAHEVVRALKQPLRRLSYVYNVNSIGKSVFETLYCAEGNDEHWQVHGIHDMYERSIPHLACTLVQNGPLVDDQLLRSELVCATLLMMGRLRDKRYAAHQYAPIGIRRLPVCIYTALT